MREIFIRENHEEMFPKFWYWLEGREEKNIHYQEKKTVHKKNVLM